MRIILSVGHVQDVYLYDLSFKKKTNRLIVILNEIYEQSNSPLRY